MASRLSLLFVLLACTAGYGLDPAFPPEGVPLVEHASAEAIPPWLESPEQFRVFSEANASFLDIEPADDPYKHKEWRIHLDALRHYPDFRATLVIEYLDKEAGFIDAELMDAATGKPLGKAGRKSNYTRLNTGSLRSTWIAVDLPKSIGQAAPLLKITGLDYLRAVRLLPEQDSAKWEEKDALVPVKVQPMVVLQRPMELVTTAGVDVRGGYDALQSSLEAMNELAPLARVLGFTAIESYVSWKRLEPEKEGEFNFSFYDAICEKLKQYDLKWFPLLIVGSAYALPEWFRESPENRGFVCLEHGIENDIQSIWSPTHQRHVERVLHAFGDHYEPMGILQGVRLGPSGNYGESQYPAGGNWGSKEQPMHIHIGWWAGDPDGLLDYRQFLKDRYGDIAKLNAAWQEDYAGFEAIKMVLPEYMRSQRQRVDFTAWYTDSMSEWCELWAKITRDALPNTVIDQSAGGWGFRESGTDYSAQAKSMKLVNGGIRLTNETDSYEQNFYCSRLAATAARLYEIPLGSEPASSHTARGTVGRLFETATTNAGHFFTYHSNIFNQPMSIDRWLKYTPMLDERAKPIVDVAIYYPETFNQLEDSTFRHLYAWGFNPRAAAIRRVVEVDYLDDRLLREGYLDRYKTLVFCWGDVIEADVLALLDQWVQRGGVLLYPSFPRGSLSTVEGDTATFEKWADGTTGAGKFQRFKGDMEPTSEYGDFAKEILLAQENLHPWTKLAVQSTHPEQVFLSVMEDGQMMVLNYEDSPAQVGIPGIPPLEIEPYGIACVALPK